MVRVGAVRAGHRRTDGVRHDERSRAFVWGEVPGADGFQVGGIDGRARSWLAIGDDEFSPLFVGYADHGRFEDGRVAGQDIFYFLGVYVFSAANDDLLGAPDQRQIAVLVDMTDIAVDLDACVVCRLLDRPTGLPK
ncbi:hypothetical protein [Nocardia africana]